MFTVAQVFDRKIYAPHNSPMDFATPESVAELIRLAGGQSKLAKRMGFSASSGRQRVENWRANGRIPPMVVKAYAPLFKRIMARQKLTA